MFNNYQIISPSLDGVLNDACMSYGGIIRPVEVIRILDGPATKKSSNESEDSELKIFGLSDQERETLYRYYQDLCSVFLKKMSSYVCDDKEVVDDSVKLQAMLQEIIRIRRLRSENGLK